MQILSIHLKNIKSHRNTTINFSAGINVLSGPNGAGKSTIFEAIGYALFGVDARDFVSNIDRFISIGTKRGEISVVFQTAVGDTWKVTRTVGTPAKWLLAKENGGTFEVEEHAKIEETENRIADLLGLNNGRPLADQFKLVIGPFQNDFLGPFIIKQPTRRQEAFDEILGIDAWRKTYKGTSDLSKAIQKRIEILAAEVKLLQEQVAVLPQKEEEIAANLIAVKQKQSELTVREANLKKAEAALIELDVKEKDITALTTEIGRLNERIAAGIDKISGQVKRVEEARKAKVIVEESRTGKEAYDKADARLTELRRQEQQHRIFEKEVVRLEQDTQRLSQTISHEQAEIATIDAHLDEEAHILTTSRQSLQADPELLNNTARLPQLRQDVEQRKAEKSLLEGRRGGLEEGHEKLAEGVCPFFQEQCLNVAERTPHDVFSRKIADIDQTMRDLDNRIIELNRNITTSESAEKELDSRRIRLGELEKQAGKLEQRRKQNHERREKLKAVTVQQVTAAQLLLERKTALQAFAALDKNIETAEQERKQYQAARDAFTTHTRDADELTSRTRDLEKWQKALTEIKEQVTDKQNKLNGLHGGYQAEQHQTTRNEKDVLLTDIATLRQQCTELENNRLRLETDIENIRKILETLKGKQAKITTCESKEKLVKFLRNQVFKNVSVQLSERFREEISLRADRIYRTIAESDEELYWGDNYQIILRDMVDSVIRERSDDQLSGGQMMSAVVALRLALLQSIGARIAFFDEPTSNLDAARRENLARAFHSIDIGREEVTEHWYDQLFLVSHDIAFTEITDKVIEL